jgi:sulfatase modifying factor 1
MANNDFIFISYAEEDGEIVKQIADGIEKEGYTAWYYQRDGGIPGRSFLDHESEIILQSHALIIVISHNSLDSNEVHTELDFARKKRKPIIYVLSSIMHDDVEKNDFWSIRIGTSVCPSIPAEGVKAIIPRIIAGLKALKIQPSSDNETSKKPDIQITKPETISEDKTKLIIPKNEIMGKDGAPMVLILAGEFLMGSDDGLDDGKPAHTVYLDDFYMDKYEVTNAQYRKFMDATKHEAPEFWNDSDYNTPNHPVVGVSWNDAVAYAEWAGKRLPTESEWEKSARGGLVGKKYPWGDTLTHDDANYYGTGGKDKWKYTSPVGSFDPNGYGLYDMAGNVWEWCADWYSNNYYANSPKSNPKGPSSGLSRVLRGGSWYYFDDNALRVTSRDYGDPSSMNNSVGFRCVGL